MEDASNGPKNARRIVNGLLPAPFGRDSSEAVALLLRLNEDEQFRRLSCAHRYQVSIAVLKWGNGDGWFWTSHQQWATLAGVKPAGIRRLLKRLETLDPPVLRSVEQYSSSNGARTHTRYELDSRFLPHVPRAAGGVYPQVHDPLYPEVHAKQYIEARQQTHSKTSLDESGVSSQTQPSLTQAGQSSSKTTHPVHLQVQGVDDYADQYQWFGDLSRSEKDLLNTLGPELGQALEQIRGWGDVEELLASLAANRAVA